MGGGVIPWALAEIARVSLELLGRYSKLPAPPAIRRTTRGRIANSPRPRVHSIARRLDQATVAAMAADYEAGTPTTRLTAEYGLSKGTVLKLLREHGHPSPGLAHSEARQNTASRPSQSRTVQDPFVALCRPSAGQAHRIDSDGRLNIGYAGPCRCSNRRGRPARVMCPALLSEDWVGPGAT